MPEPSANEPSTPEQEPSHAEALAVKVNEYEAAIRSHAQAARLALESTRRTLGMQTGVVDALLSGDTPGHIAEVEGQLYEGADAIAEFAAVLKAGGVTSAQFYKLSGAASQLALYALDLSELVKL